MMNDDHYFHNIPSSADVPREDFEHLIEGISQQRDIVGSIPTLLTSRIQPYEDISVITFGNFLSFCIWRMICLVRRAIWDMIALSSNSIQVKGLRSSMNVGIFLYKFGTMLLQHQSWRGFSTKLEMLGRQIDCYRKISKVKLSQCINIKHSDHFWGIMNYSDNGISGVTLLHVLEDICLIMTNRLCGSMVPIFCLQSIMHGNIIPLLFLLERMLLTWKMSISKSFVNTRQIVVI